MTRAHAHPPHKAQPETADNSGILARQGWGPWASSIDVVEVKSRLRVLRAIVRLLAGPAGNECRHALLTALIDPDEETLAAASAAFERMPAILRRRTLSTYLAEAQEVRP